LEATLPSKEDPMKPLPRTVTGAMIVVAIIAVNFAFGGTVFQHNEEGVIGAAVPFVLMDVATSRKS
jgi:hypothetical protein